MMAITRFVLLFVIAAASFIMAEGPLPSWNNTPTKKRIIEFIENSATPNHLNFIPREERIATLDNDGTLIIEKPTYVQGYFLFYQVEAFAKKNPEIASRGAIGKFMCLARHTQDPSNEPVPPKLNVKDLREAISTLYKGLTLTELNTQTDQFLATQKSKRFDRPFTSLIYQPMLELIALLQSKDYEVYICTGGGTNFVRNYSPKVYNIATQKVIGTALETEYSQNEFTFTGELVLPVNNFSGKAVNIQRIIGKRPVFAIGNSDGDIEMLELSTGFSALVHHDDATREYAYDKGAEIALERARKNNWTIISMKDDFAVVFPP